MAFTNQITEKELLEMPLLSRITIPDTGETDTITRVPGGWVFDNMQGCCFIPEPIIDQIVIEGPPLQNDNFRLP